MERRREEGGGEVLRRSGGRQAREEGATNGKGQYLSHETGTAG